MVIPIRPNIPPEVDVSQRTRKGSRTLNQGPSYKIICISIYNENLVQLDRLVDELKSRGVSGANRSSLLRFAFQKIDLDEAAEYLGGHNHCP